MLTSTTLASCPAQYAQYNIISTICLVKYAQHNMHSITYELNKNYTLYRGMVVIQSSKTSRF